MLIPLQLPFDVINSVVNAASHGKVQLHLTNPLVQVLQPPLAILVNLGYTDVDPAAGYTRTLLRPGETVPFGTLPSLTPAQWSDVPGAVSRALLAGIRDAVLNPFGVRNTHFDTSPSPAVPTNSLPTQRNQADTGLSEPAGSSPLAANIAPNSHAPTDDPSANTAWEQIEMVTGETRDSQTQVSRQTRASDGESRITPTPRSGPSGPPASAMSSSDVVGASAASTGPGRTDRIQTDPTPVTGAEPNTVNKASTELHSTTRPTSQGAQEGTSNPTDGDKPSNADSDGPTSGADNE